MCYVTKNKKLRNYSMRIFCVGGNLDPYRVWVSVESSDLDSDLELNNGIDPDLDLDAKLDADADSNLFHRQHCWDRQSIVWQMQYWYLKNLTAYGHTLCSKTFMPFACPNFDAHNWFWQFLAEMQLRK